MNMEVTIRRVCLVHVKIRSMVKIGIIYMSNIIILFGYGWTWSWNRCRIELELNSVIGSFLNREGGTTM